MHNTRIIIKLSTIIWCRKHCYEFSVGVELVAVRHNLMCPTYQINFVAFAEGVHYGFVEFVANTTIIISPPGHIPQTADTVGSSLLLFGVGGVGPEEIAH